MRFKSMGGSILILQIVIFPVLVLPAYAGASIGDARVELYAARYSSATELYRKSLTEDPLQPDAYYGLVRALLGDRHAKEAYAVAAQALTNVPQTAGAQTAAGMAEYRRGSLAKAEDHFRAALKLDPKYPGALKGLASIFNSVSRFKGARELLAEAYKYSPDDPALAVAHANTLRGAEHIAALEKIVPIYDPQSREARGLRSHIAADKAIGDRKVRRLTSPYETTQMKLVQLYDSPSRKRGVGLRVRFNDRQTSTLLLDTGASGISLTRRAAEKAGLDLLTNETTEMNGIGSEPAQDSFHYLASEVRVGNVTFADYPVDVEKSLKSLDYDGIIGADVFQRFLIVLDVPALELILEPRPKHDPSQETDSTDAEPPAPGFQRMQRFGNHLTIPTSVNQQANRLFLIDTGASTNLIDTDVASESTATFQSSVTVKGLQGSVKRTSEASQVSLLFGGFQQDNPDMLAISLQSISDSMGVGLAGILGIPVLSQLKLTIDYHGGTVRFDHRK